MEFLDTVDTPRHGDSKAHAIVTWLDRATPADICVANS
jgi:hypothetical protein